jgi:hypothetical protein
MGSPARPRTHLLVGVVAVISIAVLGACEPVPPRGDVRCDITWGSLPRSGEPLSPAPVVDVRAGQHDCFDRVVVDLRSGPAPGYFVEYVDEVRQGGSGRPVPLRGGAQLRVIVRAPAHDRDMRPTYDPADASEAVDVTGFSTLRQIAFASSFEGRTTIGVGVRARLPYRVFTLGGPGGGTRLVVDVAHRWS